MAKRQQNSPRQIPWHTRNAIADYRSALLEEMLKMKEGPNAPLWIRNREADRIILMADAWVTRELFERANVPSSGRTVLEHLQSVGKIAHDALQSIKKRVEEVLSLADDLIDKGIWPNFDSGEGTVVKEMGHGLPAETLWKQINAEFSPA